VFTVFISYYWILFKKLIVNLIRLQYSLVIDKAIESGLNVDSQLAICCKLKPLNRDSNMFKVIFFVLMSHYQNASFFSFFDKTS
jgi:hypothetical protein